MKILWQMLNGLMMVVLVGLVFLSPVNGRPPEQVVTRAAQGSAAMPGEARNGIVTYEPVAAESSPPVSSLPLASPEPLKLDREINPRLDLNAGQELPARILDPLLATSHNPSANIPAPLLSFDGMSYASVGASWTPPDTTGDVGPNHYVQMVNSHFQIYNKSGVSIAGPFAINSLWTGSSQTACRNNNDGDPIVLYDSLADRWMLSQFVVSTKNQCIAISQTPDPTGAYHLYQFSVGPGYDYPKFGAWPDGYYMSQNSTGNPVFVFERAKMLTGATAKSFSISTGSSNFVLPADLDGSTPPPAGAPNYIYTMNSSNQLRMWALTTDWNNTANSTLTALPNITLSAYNFDVCGTSWDCIPQQGTTQKVDAIGEWPMVRLVYRNFGTHETLLGNFTVSLGDFANHAGIRWFELRKTTGNWTLYQNGTVGPDSHHRWMGSIAMDKDGNIGLGYSVSSGSMYPAVRYTGRLATDAPGTMQTEASFIEGTGSQSGSNRWGDYSSMGIDPADDCTFWYTNEYLLAGGQWRTRIGSFKFPGCGTPDFLMETTPTELSVCVGDTALYITTLTALSGYAETVSLSVAGAPAEATTGFAPTAGVPDFESVLTLADFDIAGTYALTLSGAGASQMHTTAVTLQVSAAAPDSAALIAPADGATGVEALPIFAWDATPGAFTYDFQMAADPAFTTLIETAVGLTTTTYTPAAALDAASVYYWRVRASNGCGAGEWAETAAFVTQIAGCSTLYGPEGFESGTAGWTTGGIGNTWQRSTARAYSGSYAFYANGVATVSDQRLESPSITLPADATSVTLKHWNWRNIETSTGGCYDGGILEVSTDGGSNWTQVPNADIPVDPYNGVINSSFSNPLGGRDAWCGNVGAWRESQADLSAYAGQTVKLRFRLGTDSSTSREGWYIDDVSLEICQPVAAINYSTLTGSYGVAWHSGDGDTYLGSAWDVADGVTRNPATNWVPGAQVQLQINAHSPGYLAAWFDWNNDGLFQETEQVVAQTIAAGGLTDVFLTIPADGDYLTGQQVKARFRFYAAEPTRAPRATEAFAGDGGFGEVEDYTWDFGTNAVNVTAFAGRPASLHLAAVALVALVCASWIAPRRRR